MESEFQKIKKDFPESGGFILKKWNFETNSADDYGSILLMGKNDILKIYCRPEIWEYRVGSIKIIDHWLKARKFSKINRGLRWDELKILIIIKFIIEKTLNLREKISALVTPIEECFPARNNL